MPDTPDFDRIAREVVSLLQTQEVDQFPDMVAEQLRLMWNARGAADVAKIHWSLSWMMGDMKAGSYIKELDRALRTLDR
jgi:hypothetical protein